MIGKYKDGSHIDRLFLSTDMGMGLASIDSERLLCGLEEIMSVLEQGSNKAGQPPRAGRRKPKRTPKGRQVDPVALADVQALLTDKPRRRDLLIEHLHLIQDQYGHLSAAHLAALAFEMKLALTEVYEVATFYAHFDVVKDGPPPPAVTIRVCDSLSCAMAGAEKLLAKLPGILGKEVRVVRAPCMGACDRAPVAAVGHVQTFHATSDKIAAAAKTKPHAHAWHTSACLLYTSPSPRDGLLSRMPSSA